MDEATFALGGNRARYGWSRRGIPKTTQVTLSRKKRHVFGVLAQDDMYFMFYDGVGTATFIGFLERVRRRFCPVLVFLDNASWHKAKAVRNYVSECGDIRLECLPPYTPGRNQVEAEWRAMRDAMGNGVFGDLPAWCDQSAP